MKYRTPNSTSKGVYAYMTFTNNWMRDPLNSGVRKIGIFDYTTINQVAFRSLATTTTNRREAGGAKMSSYCAINDQVFDFGPQAILGRQICFKQKATSLTILSSTKSTKVRSVATSMTIPIALPHVYLDPLTNFVLYPAV